MLVIVRSEVVEEMKKEGGTERIMEGGIDA